ncbi:hypothetical protein ACMFMG_012246 [Clarireedia jacksonii]
MGIDKDLTYQNSSLPVELFVPRLSLLEGSWSSIFLYPVRRALCHLCLEGKIDIKPASLLLFPKNSYLPSSKKKVGVRLDAAPRQQLDPMQNASDRI